MSDNTTGRSNIAVDVRQQQPRSLIPQREVLAHRMHGLGGSWWGLGGSGWGLGRSGWGLCGSSR